MSRNKIAAATITAAALGLGIVGYNQITRANDSDEPPHSRVDDVLLSQRGYLANHQAEHGGAQFFWPADNVQARNLPAIDGESGAGSAAPSGAATVGTASETALSEDSRPYFIAGAGRSGRSLPFAANTSPTGGAFGNGGYFSGLNGGGFGGGASRGGGGNGSSANAHDGPPPADHHHDGAPTDGKPSQGGGSNDPHAGDHNPPPSNSKGDEGHEHHPGPGTGYPGHGTEYPPDHGWYDDHPGRDNPPKDVHSVPEPATIGLFAIGGLAAAALRRRRKADAT